MFKHLIGDCAPLYNTAVTGNISPHYSDASGLTVRLVHRSYYIIVFYGSAFNIFSDSPSCRCYQACIYQVFLCKFIYNRLHTARKIQVMHVCRARRCQMTQIGNFSTEFIEYVQVKLNARFISYGQQMQHAV